VLEARKKKQTTQRPSWESEHQVDRWDVCTKAGSENSCVRIREWVYIYVKLEVFDLKWQSLFVWKTCKFIFFRFGAPIKTNTLLNDKYLDPCFFLLCFSRFFIVIVALSSVWMVIYIKHVFFCSQKSDSITINTTRNKIKFLDFVFFAIVKFNKFESLFWKLFNFLLGNRARCCIGPMQRCICKYKIGLGLYTKFSNRNIILFIINKKRPG
jgi:hypothetical protein